MQNHFDSVAKDWDKNSIHILRTNAIAKAMLEKISFNKSMKALEFGSGTGLLSFELKDYFDEITLMDSSVEMSKIAENKISEAKISNLKTQVFDLEKEKYTDKKFDIIFSQMALHHVKNIDVFLNKLFKLLNSKGILSIADLYKEEGTFHDGNANVHFGFELEYLTAELINSGFENIEIKHCYDMKKIDSDGIERTYPLFLLTANKN